MDSLPLSPWVNPSVILKPGQVMLSSPGLSLVIRKLDSVIQVPFSNILERKKLIFIYSMLVFILLLGPLFRLFYLLFQKKKKFLRTSVPILPIGKPRPSGMKVSVTGRWREWNSRINRATPKGRSLPFCPHSGSHTLCPEASRV